jgi:hypothetical protein
VTVAVTVAAAVAERLSVRPTSNRKSLLFALVVGWAGVRLSVQSGTVAGTTVNFDAATPDDCASSDVSN